MEKDSKSKINLYVICCMNTCLLLLCGFLDKESIVVNLFKPRIAPSHINKVNRHMVEVSECKTLSAKEIVKKSDIYFYEKEDAKRGCACLKQGLERELPDIYAVWGNMLLDRGTCIDNPHKAKGIAYLKKSIEKGSALGMRFLARYYVKAGQVKTGLDLLKLASDKKDAMSLYEYGSILTDGDFSIYGTSNLKVSNLINSEKGKFLLNESAKQGNPYALLRMSDILYVKDRKKAFDYITRAYKAFEEQNEVSYLLDIEEQLETKYKIFINKK